MTQVFISYSRRDLPFVEQLARDLKNAGLDVWYDLSGLEGGQRWGSEIQDAIRQSQYFIVVLSPSSVASDWVEKEFMYAYNLGRKVVPILYQECEIPMWVSNLHFIDMQKGNYQKNFAALLGVLGLDTGTEKEVLPVRYERDGKKRSLPRSRRRMTIAFAIGGSLFVGFLILAGVLWGDDLAASLFPTKTATSTFTPPSTFTPAHTSTPTTTITPTLGIGSTMIRPSDGMIMVYVPEGEFTMGSSEGLWQNQPAHPVDLDAYWIDQTEVTTSMYALCVSAGQCDLPHIPLAPLTSYYGDSAFADYPVGWVDWEDASDYCEWAGVRLPTEAEWEKAARGTDERTYPWGNDAPACTLANFVLSGVGACAGDIAPVGSYPSGASPYGALDLAGNVEEWVADWFGIYPATLVLNPSGPTSGEERIGRGAGMQYQGWLASWLRWPRSPYYNRFDTGFRCALSSP